MSEHLLFFLCLMFSGLGIYVFYLARELKKTQEFSDALLKSILESSPEELMHQRKILLEWRNELNRPIDKIF